MEKRLLAPDLYAYLIALSSSLKSIAEDTAAQRVLHVSKFASGSTSELYGEARAVLPQILLQYSARLSELETARLREVIAGIEREFARIGGA